MESSQTCPPCSAGPTEEVRALCRREGGEGRGRGRGRREEGGERVMDGRAVQSFKGSELKARPPLVPTLHVK